ncbi:MAG: Type I restriction-modification system, M subunit [Euryarchaeota archaeon 55_53]|nr:MAG: Type I restriction-modification system, M subunit [Euryarchaeota archaeon 55_53]
MKKTQLYTHLWEAANALRGGMDASQYKDYVLTILFVKYVTDRYKNDPYADFVVPEDGSFDALVEAKGKPDIGERINKVLSRLAEENELKGVIDLVDFDDSTKLGSGKEKVDRLTKLIAIFENPELNFSKNRAEGDDILGDVYEYFMKKFATEAGKSKGQFYTPAEVSRVMAKIIGVENANSPDQTAYDPTCGSGSLLLKVADEAPVEISLYGQEIDINVANLARMNMILHGKPYAVIEQGNTLSNPKFKNKDGSLKTFDFAVANPPFSQKNWMNGLVPENDPYHRFDDGIPPAKNGDYAFLLHLIKSLKPGKGKGAIILPHGVLFRGGAEAKIRRNLVRKGYIKGIIGLPPNLFYGTGIPAIIMVIDKENAHARKGIFMIDASKGFRKDGPKNRLRERDIHKIVTTFVNFEEIPGYSRMVSLEEIEKNDYNLNIPRYIDSTEEEDIQDIHAHLHGGIPKRDIDKIEGLKIFKSLKKELFEEKEDRYYQLKVGIELLQDFIENHGEVDKFKDNALRVFKNWKEGKIAFLKSIESNTKSKQFIKELSESLLDAFRSVALVDEYAVYQILMDYWDEEMKDDVYMIIENGWEAKTYRIIEKNKKGKNVDKGWTCDILPKEIVTSEFFNDEKREIEELEAKREEIQREMEEMKEEYGGEEGILEEVKNEKGNITKKDLQLKINELRWNPSEFKEELEILTKYHNLMNKESEIKKKIKEKEKELDEKLLRKYAELTEDDVKRLVVEKKWLKRLEDDLKDELDDIILEMVNRIKELAERYAEPLPEIEREVEEYEKKVKEHLKVMGFEI